MKPAKGQFKGERIVISHQDAVWTAFYGNLHMHTDYSRDSIGFEGSAHDNYLVARDVVGLDFAALTDHAEWLQPVEWWQVQKANEVSNEPGRFVTFPSYEWTSLRYGHKNLVFADDSTARLVGLFGSDDRTPDDLWAHLDDHRVLAIPHHPSQALNSPTDWTHRNDQFQRLVEVFQNRGSYEADDAPLGAGDRATQYVPGHSVRDALDMGHRLGFLASPDHGGGFGLAGAWAEDPTRESLYRALERRRTFATTGARMALFSSVNETPMGGELILPADEPVRIVARIHVEVSPFEIVVIADGQERCRQFIDSKDALFEWTDTSGPRTGTSYYYVRLVQNDGHMGWTSPIWVRADN